MNMGLFMAESLKWRRTWSLRLLLFTPLVTVVLAYVLLPSDIIQQGAYNWWYVFMLPGVIAISASLMVCREKKQYYQSLYLQPFSISRIWKSKIGTFIFLTFMTSMLFFIASAWSGWGTDDTVAWWRYAVACVVIWISCWWQLPYCLFLGAKFGTSLTMLIHWIGGLGLGLALAEHPLWWLTPYSVLLRLMCPLIQLRPNGLVLSDDHILTDTFVILPGILILLIWFFVLTIVTGKWFEKQGGRK